MRYYVLARSNHPRVKPHIIAEVVRDIDESREQREESLAGVLAGPMAEILTREELLAVEGGAAALDCWHAGHDVSFYIETVRLERLAHEDLSKGIFVRHLRLVEPLPEDGGLPRVSREHADRLIKRAAELQLSSAELVEGARALVRDAHEYMSRQSNPKLPTESGEADDITELG